MPYSVKIDRRQLIAELSSLDPILVKEARAALKQKYFDPAVKKLKEDFDKHDVTQEIKGGLGSDNISDTLIGDFREDADKADGKPNLFSFIGFEHDAKPTDEIEKRLDPSNPDGPKLTYQSKDKDSLTFRFLVKAPNEAAIADATPMPWAVGLSWSRRIEQGIPGVGYFLNSLIRRGSHSGGGIQIENKLRSGTYRPVSYLTGLFKAFLARATGGTSV